jgi:hypothetical protein
VHLRLIGYALLAYQRVVALQGKIKEEDALLLAIKNLRQRISAVKVPGEGELSFLLDFDELIIILSALTAFIDMLFILLPLTTPVEDTDLERTKVILKRHAVSMHKIPTFRCC